MPLGACSRTSRRPCVASWIQGGSDTSIWSRISSRSFVVSSGAEIARVPLTVVTNRPSAEGSIHRSSRAAWRISFEGTDPNASDSAPKTVTACRETAPRSSMQPKATPGDRGLVTRVRRAREEEPVHRLRRGPPGPLRRPHQGPLGGEKRAGRSLPVPPPSCRS